MVYEMGELANSRFGASPTAPTYEMATSPVLNVLVAMAMLIVHEAIRAPMMG